MPLPHPPSSPPQCPQEISAGSKSLKHSEAPPLTLIWDNTKACYVNSFLQITRFTGLKSSAEVSLVELYPSIHLSLRLAVCLLGILPDLSFIEVKSVPLGLDLQISGPLALTQASPGPRSHLCFCSCSWHFKKRGQGGIRGNGFWLKFAFSVLPIKSLILLIFFFFFSYLDEVCLTFSVFIRNSKRTVR